MVLINVVDCYSKMMRVTFAEMYMKEHPTSRLLTEDTYVFKKLYEKYGDKVVYGKGLLQLWFQFRDNDILFISNVDSMLSPIYKDIVANYEVIPLQSSEVYCG